MKTYRRRKGVIAWQYDTEENFWKWTKEAKFTLGYERDYEVYDKVIDDIKSGKGLRKRNHRKDEGT